VNYNRFAKQMKDHFSIAKPNGSSFWRKFLGFVLLAQLVRFRIDLTEEKRFSIHP